MSFNKNLNIVFMGTPDFAVASLQALLDDEWNVQAVVTQPDRPKGRRRALTPPPVKQVAVEAGIRVLQPERLRSEDAMAEVERLQPDLIITAAYGQILPKRILDLPQYGCINVHASLLPKYRGGAPIHHAIIRGEAKTGVTIMYMDVGLDTGDIIRQREIAITDEDTVGTCYDKLKTLGAELLIATLPELVQGNVQRIPQNEAEATYAPNISPEDERIDWHVSARDVFNRVRGLNPWPVAYTTLNGERLKIWRCALDHTKRSDAGHSPGTIVECRSDGIAVQTGDGTIVLTELQPAGKRAMPVAEFLRGTSIAVGTVLGDPK